MAGDSDITVVKLAKNDIVTFTAAGIIAESTGAAYLDVSTMDASKVLLLVKRSGAGAATIVVPDGGKYTGGTVGNLTQLTSAAGEYVIGPLETAIYKDSNGYIKVNMSTASTTTLTVRAILLP